MQKLYESIYAPKFILLYTIFGSLVMGFQALTETPSKWSLVTYASIAFVITVFDLLIKKLPSTASFIKTFCLFITPTVALLATVIDFDTFVLPDKNLLNSRPWADSLTILSISILLVAYGIRNFSKGQFYEINEVIEILHYHNPGDYSATIIIPRDDTLLVEKYRNFVVYKSDDGAIKCNYDNKVLPSTSHDETHFNLKIEFMNNKWNIQKHSV